MKHVEFRYLRESISPLQPIINSASVKFSSDARHIVQGWAKVHFPGSVNMHTAGRRTQILHLTPWKRTLAHPCMSSIARKGNASRSVHLHLGVGQVSDQQEYSFRQHESNGLCAAEMAINRPSAAVRVRPSRCYSSSGPSISPRPTHTVHDHDRRSVMIICSLSGRENTCTFAVLYNIKRTTK